MSGYGPGAGGGVRGRDVACAATGWGLLVLGALTGVVSLSLIDQVVLLGIAVVLPLALGGVWPWAVSSLFVLMSFGMSEGPAAVMVVPFVVVTGYVLAASIGDAGPLFFWRRYHVIRIVAALFAVVASGALITSRAGLALFDVGEPIVELTAVHFMFAGTAALVLAARALDEADGRWERVAFTAVALTAGAPPVVALGFVTGHAIPQVAGAVLMTAGVWLTAGLQLRSVVVDRLPRARTFLLAISGLSVWVPMVLAVAWAAGQHWDIPALSIPDMARTHGLVNALAFVLCGLLARTPVCGNAGGRSYIGRQAV